MNGQVLFKLHLVLIVLCHSVATLRAQSSRPAPQTLTARIEGTRKMRLLSEVQLRLQDSPAVAPPKISAIAVNNEKLIGVVEYVGAKQFGIRIFDSAGNTKSEAKLPSEFDGIEHHWLVCTSSTEWTVLGAVREGLIGATYDGVASRFRGSRTLSPDHCLAIAQDADYGFVALFGYSESDVVNKVMTFGQTLRRINSTSIQRSQGYMLCMSLAAFSNGNSIIIDDLSETAIEISAAGQISRRIDLRPIKELVKDGKLGRIWVKGGKTPFVSVSDGTANWLIEITPENQLPKPPWIKTPLDLFSPYCAFSPPEMDEIYWSDSESVRKINRLGVDENALPSLTRKGTVRVCNAVLTDDDKLVIADWYNRQLLIFRTLSDRASAVPLAPLEVNETEIDPDGMSAIGNDEIVLGYKSAEDVGIFRVNIVSGALKKVPSPGLHARASLHFDPAQEAVWGSEDDRLMLFSKVSGVREVVNWNKDRPVRMATVVPTNAGPQMAVVVDTLFRDATSMGVSERFMYLTKASDKTMTRVPVQSNVISGYMNKNGTIVLREQKGFEFFPVGASKGVLLNLEKPFASREEHQWALLPNRSNELWVLCSESMSIKRYVGNEEGE